MADGSAGVRDHLGFLARGPRAAGGAVEDAARRYCKTWLETHGFSVAEEPFAFSSVVGRYATPVAGSLLAVGLGLAAMSIRLGANPAATIGMVALLAAVVAVAGSAALRLVLALPWQREASRNLVATRGVPAVWLVAHLDTKSQPVPILVRAAAAVVTGVAILAAALLAASRLGGGPTEASLWAGCASAVVLALGVVGDESPGAADNATGVAVTLEVARLLPPGVSLGIVLTSAEELALAGARAWGRSRAPGTAVNLDTIDDRGALRAMVHGRAGRGLAAELRRAFGTGDDFGTNGGVPSRASPAPPRTSPAPPRRRGPSVVRLMPLAPGILTDGVALAQEGWRVVTLSRAGARTLWRIHRRSDSVEHLTGTGASQLAGALAAWLSQRS